MEVPYTIAQVDNCRFNGWYDALKKVSIKSISIPVPESFIGTLLEDKIQVEEELYPVEFVNEVNASIQELGGSVVPKLDWSCPKDAKWILGNSLRCRTLEDIVVLLKASDFIVHDLTQVYAGCCDNQDQAKTRPQQFHLVLKKWCNFFDSMHFRCFVVHNALVAITQRNCTEYYDFLQTDATQDKLCDLLVKFYDDNLKHCDALPDDKYVFDVYIDKNDRVFLLDINVFGPKTDPLLFTWKELHELTNRGNHDEPIDFRVAASQNAEYSDPYSQYRVPVDLVDHLATPGGFDAFIRQVAQDNMASDSDSDQE